MPELRDHRDKNSAENMVEWFQENQKPYLMAIKEDIKETNEKTNTEISGKLGEVDRDFCALYQLAKIL